MKNVEIKARCTDPARVRSLLEAAGAHFHGIDRQRDTYFPVPNGRLKLREGRIENHLIHYRRPDQAGPKRSDVLLFDTTPDSALKPLLTAALGVRIVVEKRRAIYFIGNVKFHVDAVDGLGAFVEIEAIDRDGSRSEADLLAQCRSFMDALDIAETDLVERSYSDMLSDE